MNLYQVWYTKTDNKSYTKAEKADNEERAKIQVFEKVDNVVEIVEIKKLGSIVGQFHNRQLSRRQFERTI